MKTETEKPKRNYESPPFNPFLNAVNRIVEVCVERQAFFETRPKVLACWMDVYTELSYASRFLEDYYYETGNPKDALIELEDEEKVSVPYAHLVYDAWGATIDQMSESGRGERKLHPLESKMNKTADEWLQLMLDPEYRYNCLFPCRLRAIDHLMCTLGAGRGWNKDGYICDKAPSGTDGDQYIGYLAHKDELPEDLKRMAADWFTDPTIARGVALQKQARDKEREKRREQDKLLEDLRALRTSNKLKGKDKKLVDDMLEGYDREPAYTPQDIYPMSEEYCLLCTMPTNAHESYIRIGQEVCKFILQEGYEFDWAKEKKKFGSQIKEENKKHYVQSFENNRRIAREFLERHPVKEN